MCQLIKPEGRGNSGIATVYVLQWDRCSLCNSQAQVVCLHKNGGLSDGTKVSSFIRSTISLTLTIWLTLKYWIFGSTMNKYFLRTGSSGPPSFNYTTKALRIIRIGNPRAEIK